MNEIPQSPALAEADPQSLQHLFSIDPEHFTQQDLDAVIAECRALRERLDAAIRAGTKPKLERAKSAPGVAAVNLEDLGL